MTWARAGRSHGGFAELHQTNPLRAVTRNTISSDGRDWGVPVFAETVLWFSAIPSRLIRPHLYSGPRVFVPYRSLCHELRIGAMEAARSLPALLLPTDKLEAPYRQARGRKCSLCNLGLPLEHPQLFFNTDSERIIVSNTHLVL